MSKTKGSIKFYKEVGGFGFIRIDTGGDIFFHISDWPPECDDPVEGDRVCFVVVKSPRDDRPRAINVRPLPPADAEQPSVPNLTAAATEGAA
jgi:cold shock CspA family protein